MMNDTSLILWMKIRLLWEGSFVASVLLYDVNEDAVMAFWPYRSRIEEYSIHRNEEDEVIVYF